MLPLQALRAGYDCRMSAEPTLDRVAGVLQDDPRITAAVVFGSVARGSARPDSDLDLAVLYTDPAARESATRDWLALTGRLALAAGRDLHLVDLEAVDAGLRRAILDGGHVLLDREPRRLRDLRVATGIEYLDWEHARRIADEAHARRLARRHG